MFTSGLFKMDISIREYPLRELDATDARDLRRALDDLVGVPFDKTGLIDPCEAGILIFVKLVGICCTGEDLLV